MLPLEILTLIVDLCHRSILHPLLSVDSTLYSISSPRLYKAIILNGWNHRRGHPTGILTTLAENQELAALVQEFTIDLYLFNADDVAYYHDGDFLDLFLRALKNMVNLKYVSMSNASDTKEEQDLVQIAAAIQSRSITTFYVEMHTPKSILKQIVQHESLTELGLICEGIDENVLIEILQDKAAFPNLKYLQAAPDTLALFAKYHMVKKMTVNFPDKHYNGGGNCAEEVVGVISEKCPEILNMWGFFIDLSEWLEVLDGLVIHGSTLKSHAVGLLLEGEHEDEDDEIWEQIGSRLKKLSGLHHLDLWAKDILDFEDTSLTWQRLETVCLASCPRLLSLWTPERYFKRSSATDSWPAKPRSLERCHSCVAAEVEVYPIYRECVCDDYMES